MFIIIINIIKLNDWKKKILPSKSFFIAFYKIR